MFEERHNVWAIFLFILSIVLYVFLSFGVLSHFLFLLFLLTYQFYFLIIFPTFLFCLLMLLASGIWNCLARNCFVYLVFNFIDWLFCSTNNLFVLQNFLLEYTRVRIWVIEYVFYGIYIIFREWRFSSGDPKSDDALEKNPSLDGLILKSLLKVAGSRSMEAALDSSSWHFREEDIGLL